MNRLIRTVALVAFPVFVVFPLAWTAFPFTPLSVLAFGGAASLLGGALAVRRTDGRLHSLVIGGAGTMLGAVFGYELHHVGSVTASTIRYNRLVAAGPGSPITPAMWFDRTLSIVLGDLTSVQVWLPVVAFGVAGVVGGGAELFRRRITDFQSSRRYP